MKSHKENLLHRIKIIEGHVKAIRAMLEEDKYCVDIVHQSLAVQKSLKMLDLKIIENHMNHCVVDQIKKGDEQKAIKELIDIYNLKQS